MGKIDYNEWQQLYGNKQSKQNQVSFFSLKDGEKCLIRFVDGNPADSEMGILHIYQDGNKYRKVSCIRNPHDPIDDCPMCRENVQLSQKMYIKIIQYSEDAGEIVSKPCIWERPIGFMGKLKSLREEYGDLSQELFIASRTGEKQSTIYDVQLANPRKYDVNNYPLDADAFDNFKVFGVIVKELTYQQMEELLGNSGKEQEPLYANESQSIHKNTVLPQQETQPSQQTQRKPWEVPTAKEEQAVETPRRPKYY